MWVVSDGISSSSSPSEFDAFVYDIPTKTFLWRDKNISAHDACSNAGECSVSVAVPLPEHDGYIFRIKAKNLAGQSSWSKSVRFTVLDENRLPPNTPSVTSPSPKEVFSSDQPISIAWVISEGLSSRDSPSEFDAFIYDLSTKSFLWRERNISTAEACNISGQCSVSVSVSLPESEDYVVRLKAKNLAGQSSWTNSVRFATVTEGRAPPSVPAVTSPSYGEAFASTQDLEFVWEVSEGILASDSPSEFDAFIYDRSAKEVLWRNKTIAAAEACDIYGACSVSVSVSLPEGDDYIFRIKAKNAAGQSSWSKSVGFSVYSVPAIEFVGRCTAATAMTVFYSGSVFSEVSGGTAPYTFELDSNASRGVVDLDYNSGSFVYYPSDNGRGYLESFDVKVRDSQGQERSSTFSFVFGTRRIMPVGDSITFGVLNYNSTTGDFPLSASAVGYRKHLKELLQAGGYATEFVGPRSSGSAAGLSDSRHAGYPGWTSLHIANGRSGYASSGHLTQWLDGHTADILLIHAGTNDHSTNTYGVGQILAKADAWRTNNNVPLISMTATLVDQRRDYWNRNHLGIFNANMPLEVAAVSSARYVDMFPELDWQDDLTPYPTDITGLHPNESGYLKMAEKWYQRMVEEGVVNKCP